MKGSVDEFHVIFDYGFDEGVGNCVSLLGP